MPSSRLGIITAGGDCPGLNAVIRGIVCAAAQRDTEVVGFAEGYEGLLDPSCARLLTPANTRGIESQGGTILGSTNKGRFQLRRGPAGEPVLPDALLRATRHAMEQQRAAALIVMGGDGSLRTALHLSRAGIRVLGVPKTIDNDLDSTDVTFGFDTAVARVAEAVGELRTTAESHRRVMVVEVMGRQSGWLALHGAVAGGADLVLLPEIPFDGDNIVKFIKESERRGQRSVIAVVAEGARAKSGRQIRRQTSTGDSRLGGIGNYVESLVAARTGRETRCCALGHLQRGGTPTAFDRVLGQQFGVRAVELAADGMFGRMVSYRFGGVTDVALADAVNRRRTVTPDSQILRHARGLGICLGE
ncbi:MAG: ATP-dependent 6-phosphofructokinase [Chthoniobacterales bacterium]|nr:ATP-dependent 6-phosphofructokinase [Chthoniobacterales bacterium]